MGFAAALAQLEADLRENIKQTFIEQSEGEFLNLHGRGRGKTRYFQETDASFKQRIRIITNNSNCASLKPIIDTALAKGESSIIEWYNEEHFLNRGAFLNRGVILRDNDLINSFTVTIPIQIIQDLSFYNRGTFADRGNFMGGLVPNETLLNNLISIVNDERAFGTAWELRERDAA